MNWNNIKHFTRDEFTCRCCGKLPKNAEQNYWYLCFYILDPLREDTGSPIIINRGYSCIPHNKNIGGRPKSYHIIPRNGGTFHHPCAVDLYAPKLNSQEFDAKIRKHTNLRYCGYHIYINEVGYFMHIDWRGWKARWK